MKEFIAKFTNGKTWVGGVSFYPEDTPSDIVQTGIRMNLEAQGKIDESWQLMEFDSKPVELTSDGAIISKGESK